MPNFTKLYHLPVNAEQIGKYCILPGDPARCELIAQYLDDAQFIGQNREFVIYTGYLSGEKVSVVSTGIGAPSAAICMEELVKIDAHTFIRLGTCGGIDLAVKAGDLIIAQAAVRQDGTSNEYAPIPYPACADFDVTLALKESAEKLAVPYHIGVVQAKDSFYGQHEPENMPTATHLLYQWEAYKRLGVLASEMEASALFIVAAARKVRCGAIFTALWNQEREKAGLDQSQVFDLDPLIRTTIDAIKTLIAQDKAKSSF